jgi:hypothetical protein
LERSMNDLERSMNDLESSMNDLESSPSNLFLKIYVLIIYMSKLNLYKM